MRPTCGALRVVDVPPMAGGFEPAAYRLIGSNTDVFGGIFVSEAAPPSDQAANSLHIGIKK